MKWLRIEFLRKIDNPLFGHLVRARSEAVAHLQVFQKALSHLGHFFCSDRPGIGLAPTARLQPQSSEPDSPLTHATGSIQFVARRQGSSAVEQGTHKPLVGSSILPSGTFLRGLTSLLSLSQVGREIFLAATNDRHKANPVSLRDGTGPSFQFHETPVRKIAYAAVLGIFLGRKEKKLHPLFRHPNLRDAVHFLVVKNAAPEGLEFGEFW